MGRVKKEKPEHCIAGTFTSFSQAYELANKQYPPDLETLERIRDVVNRPLRTKDDFRWFVMFNLLRSISEHLDDSKEHAFQMQIQENIVLAADRHLK